MYISMEVAVISEIPNDTGIVLLAKKFQIEKNSITVAEKEDVRCGQK